MASAGGKKGKSMPTMEEGREQATQATYEVFASLAALDLAPRFADGGYHGCAEPTVFGDLGWRDDAGGWRYSAKGRLDLPDGQAGSASLARQVRDKLVDDGWKPLTGQLESIDGIQEARGADRWIVRADRGYLSISVDCYADEPLVLVGIYGPCLPTTEEQKKEYMSADTDKFDVGGNER